MRTIRLSTAVAALFWLGLLLAWADPVRPQEPPLADGPPLAAPEGAPADEDEPPDGVEVLARGPVHEAFAEPADTRPRQGPLAPKQPPDPVEEMPPDEKPEGSIWIPGYWSWDEERDNFIWVSGFWRVPPPERQWVPGYWTQAGANWQWVPGYWNFADQAEVAALPAPPEPLEAGPSTPAPGADYVYQPGVWVYRERYIWRPGCWVLCRPGWVWVPAHYVWTPCGYVFVEGYWDYTLRDRGLLFAPVAVNVAVIRPGWYYRPRYVIYDDCLYGALFVRPGCGYYFGDYFDPCYARAGYVSWCEVRIGGGCHDPLFSYYRWHHHRYCGDSGWEVGIRGLFVARYRNEVPRPPRTLIAQKTVVNNINVTNVHVHKTQVNNIQNTTMLTSIKNVDKKVVKLEKVPKEKLVQEQQAARQLREVSRKRGQVESQSRGADQGQPVAPRVVKLDLPKQQPAPRPAAKAPPPAPVKVERRPGPAEHLHKDPNHSPAGVRRSDTPSVPGKTLAHPGKDDGPRQPAKVDPKGPQPLPKVDPKGPKGADPPLRQGQPLGQPKDLKPPLPARPQPLPAGQPKGPLPTARPMPAAPQARPMPVGPAGPARKADEPRPKDKEKDKKKN